MPEFVYFLLVFGGMLIGIQGERWRAAWSRSEWRARVRRQGGYPRKWPRAVASSNKGEPDLTDATHQLKLVMAAPFEKRRLLSPAEAKVLYVLEDVVQRIGKGWRVMAQVNLGEILSCNDKRAFSAINSKRVDLLIVCKQGFPIAAFEYQGEGHYQGNAPARDAVKKEALRRAGVRYFEVTPEHGSLDLEREVMRISENGQLKKAG